MIFHDRFILKWSLYFCRFLCVFSMHYIVVTIEITGTVILNYLVEKEAFEMALYTNKLTEIY
jgi:hypothetical protein